MPGKMKNKRVNAKMKHAGTGESAAGSCGDNATPFSPQFPHFFCVLCYVLTFFFAWMYKL